MSEDLIRRSDAIKAITDISKNYTGKGKRNYHPHIDFLVDALKYDVPTIEPKRGEWNKPNYGQCSNCRGWAIETENGYYFSDFCPNCGARMKGADDES